MVLPWLTHFRAPLRGVSTGCARFEVTTGPICSLQQINPQTRLITGNQTRGYANMSEGWGFKKVQYTKYRITKPWTTDTQFDDLLLSEPSRDSLAKFTKETPLFLRFLKLITDVENRPRAFIEFAKRCENGLIVEKDAFITKEELMKCIWENGFSQNEMNAFEFAFPADYKFHYPELAVLFDLPEEDCYKYCIRQRAKTPEKLVEIKYEKPKNLLSSYGLCFLGVWYGFSNQVLSNAWFYSKTFPFGAVFYMLASYFYRNIREYLWKEEKAMIEGAKDRKDAGEELVHRQLKKYANDARCLEYISSFKDEVQQQLAEYHAALLEQMRQKLVERISGKLMAIQKAEKAIQDSLQEVIVRELVESFHRKFATDAKMQDLALKAAIEGVSGEAPSAACFLVNAGEFPHTPTWMHRPRCHQLPVYGRRKRFAFDPVGAHFLASLKELRNADIAKSKPDGNGSVLERVSAVFQRREEEFLQSFTVSPEEANEVKQLVAKCKSGDGYDFTKLSEEDAARLDALQLSIHERVGYSTVMEDDVKPLKAVGPSGEALIEHVNNQLGFGIEVKSIPSTAETSDGLLPHLADSHFWKKLSFTQFVIYLVGFSEGLTHLAALAIYYMLKDDLGLSPAEVSALFIAPALPWVFKPIFAFISDSYPLYGSRRKPYMIAFSLLEGLGFIMLGTFPTHILTALLSLFIISISAAFCSAVAEALVVETTAGRSMDQSAENVSDFITAKAVGSLIVAYLSGYLLERTSKQSIFLATSIFPLFIALITTFMTDEGGAPSVSRFPAVIWGPALYIFAYMAGPDYDDALFFYFTNKLGFSPTFMGTLRFTYGIAALVGVVMYRTFFKRTGFRKTLLATILVAVPIYLSPIILTTGFNRTLGISNKAFVLSGGFLIEATAEIQLLPLLVLTASICPPGLEGSVYAMMMSVRNTGAMASRGINAEVQRVKQYHDSLYEKIRQQTA
ncbi:hypothetical protein, conserved [Eimeria maxima]|uniref:Uncharacterized protein n=1 Tax=Eimeria maxima TaxID=5804 RepID=U6M7S5_EIMMA|nr:hypothetical protein, conserved [Eimeria maxima]CDJ60272.1 hypothetical protein, conserved [Eimeria maxima]